MRLRQIGEAAAEPPVEPHARLIVADLVDDGFVRRRRLDEGGDRIAIFPHEARHSVAQRAAIGSGAKVPLEMTGFDDLRADPAPN